MVSLFQVCLLINPAGQLQRAQAIMLGKTQVCLLPVCQLMNTIAEIGGKLLQDYDRREFPESEQKVPVTLSAVGLLRIIGIS